MPTLRNRLPLRRQAGLRAMIHHIPHHPLFAAPVSAPKPQDVFTRGLHGPVVIISWQSSIRCSNLSAPGFLLDDSEPSMPPYGLKSSLVAIVCGLVVLIGTDSLSAPDGPASGPLAANGITKFKKRYVLQAEQDVFRKCQETIDAFAMADQAIQELGAVSANQQALVELQQRIAENQASISNIRVAMRSGNTIALREQLRAAETDRNIAKARRGKLGPGQPKAKQVRRMQDEAQDAWRSAEASQLELRKMVREVAERYRSLAANPAVREAIGKSEFGPTDGFKKLAFDLQVPIQAPDPASGNATAMPGYLSDAIDELTGAAEGLRAIQFQRNGKDYDERYRRREQTVGAIQAAIAALKRGEVDTKLIDEATRLNRGYTNPRVMMPKVRQAIDAAGEALDKAKSLIAGNPQG
ncbi:hypothetical protein TA3x_001777 [Tundrisphaera sp. TA3]|uniref:hypothetical protein n=1 Tax=Tundrisphaera sp. TA3 TaxID=3435775 RepID=UPI003EBCA6F4